MLNFPSDCKTPAERIEYSCIAQEQLRLMHNIIADWCRRWLAFTGALPDYDTSPLPIANWQKLPDRFKQLLPYKGYLPKEKWDDFVNLVFDPISQKISAAMGQQKDLLKKSTKWTIDVGEL